MTLKPFLTSKEPVKPAKSQDGDHWHKIQRSGFSFKAISKVLFAPFRKNSVTSLPVYKLLFFLSAIVSKTLPFKRFTGSLGQGNPPSNSGQTSMSFSTFCSFSNFLTKVLYPAFLPCQRHLLSIRQELTNIFIIKCLIIQI